MDNLSVLWVSFASLSPKMYNIPHIHDYFHFTYFISGSRLNDLNNKSMSTPRLECYAPEVVHAGYYALSDAPGINVMFSVEDKRFYREICDFPFSLVPEEKMFSDLLLNIVYQIKEYAPPPEFVNSAFCYYLRLVMTVNKDLISSSSTKQLADICNDYIDKHYMENIELDDLANLIDRNRSYTCTLYSNSTGITLSERLSRVRIMHACELVAYSDDSLKDIMNKCGFTSMRNFIRVFKKYVGVTPTKYRSSHNVNDLRYDGSKAELMNMQYSPGEHYFTYVVNARKIVDWSSPYEFLNQMPDRKKR